MRAMPRLSDNPVTHLFRLTWRYAEGRRGMIVLFMTMGIIANITNLASPVIFGRLFDTLQFSPGGPEMLRGAIVNISFLLLLTLVFWALHGTSRIIEITTAFIIRRTFKRALLSRVLDLPASWHRNHHSGDTIDRVNKGSQALYDFSSNIYMLTENSVRLFGSVTVLAFYDWRASIVALGISIATLASLQRFDVALRRYYLEVFQHENNLASMLHDSISNIRTIITLRLKRSVSSAIDARAMRAYPVFRRSAMLQETKWFTASFIISAMTVGVLIMYSISSYRTTGTIAVGTLFVLYRLLGDVGDVFYNFAFRYGNIVREEAAVRAVEGIEDDHRTLVPSIATEATIPAAWRAIDIHGLTFRYEAATEGADRPAQIRDVSLALRRGERIALIGESGSGKSTTLSLLRGLDAPEHVRVTCDGEVLPHGLAHLHDAVTLVPQDPELFNSSVEENITMNVHLDRSAMEEAIDLAQFRSVLDELPNGLETNVLEKGVSLSGGQKQRLALARGILAARESSLLLLDEPTSSVDAANERAIYDGILARFTDTTIIACIHRLHLLELFDRIYLFSGGRVVAHGTLAELHEDATFAALWAKYHRKKRA